ncbi:MULTISPECIES: hypothetical protein [Acinetobacter]|uniref:Nitric oxide reductase n=2 Tax=Acinetobacter indicus TaxID=756892 RepID=A0A6C0Y3I5_9GAMM|nr:MULTISPECIES: hypothetical protein [Acinetobacter]ENW90375.1 hypothetical protein F905_00396 [Acinetobacter sp. CIP 53.82]KJV45754.1 membrane protein [Acinetobacter indicus]MBA0156937.1 hypothetical protein [Acinetobacter indicus]MDM1271000.1 hypothetical protein [Acinetobacter indicus]MDM1491753.1 hypothetical protein [Acinetobacter indicus]
MPVFEISDFVSRSLPLSFDTRLSNQVFILFLLCLGLPFLVDLHLPLLDGQLVRGVENVQAFLLLFCAIFSYFYIRPFDLADGQKQFWLWAICWWLLLFGRSISWGRDYFPEVPKVYFRAISIVLIAPVVFMLFSRHLRAEIVRKFKSVSLPLWVLILSVVGLIAADSIEHGRAISFIFLHDVAYKDFMEEMYEFPLILGLFMMTLHIMKQDKPPVVAEPVYLELDDHEAVAKN